MYTILISDALIKQIIEVLMKFKSMHVRNISYECLPIREKLVLRKKNVRRD